MHIKIYDLIHDSNMAASYQRIYFGDNLSQKNVRSQISKLLHFFDTLPEGTIFRDNFYKDFMRRADLTIEQIKKENY